MPRLDPLVAMMTSQAPISAALPAKQNPDTTPISGTWPTSRDMCQNVWQSSPLVAGPSVSTPRPPPPSPKTMTGRRLRSASRRKRSVLACPILPWVPGQHRVVVGHHGDGHTAGRSGAEHDAVGGSPLDQVLNRAGRPLRGDGQPAVLDERTLIDQVGDVLPGGAPTVGVPAFDHLRASLVERVAVPAKRLAQVVADMVRVGARGALRRAARGARRLGVGDGLARVDEVADRHAHLADNARPVRDHDVVHLHRLEHDHFGPGGELGARFGQHLHDDARHRGAQRDGLAVPVPESPGFRSTGFGSTGRGVRDAGQGRS